jgi:ribosomal protein L11 methyltransferase
LTVGTDTWRVLARIRGAEAAEAAFALLDDMAQAVSVFEVASDEWRVEAFSSSPVLTADLTARLALAAGAAGGRLVEIGEERLAGRDWLAENQLAFPPLRIGRFFVYGSHHRGVPSGAIGIRVDAATAFGTGEHPSTRGCLVALESLARRRRFRRPLDIGTGTGILSIAGAKLLRRRILASDIDARAAGVAQHNVARNGVSGLVQVGRAAGYHNRAIRKGRYDLIFSNILARPLALMAHDLARVLMPGGRAVLSGLLCRQEPIVLAPHRAGGIVLERRVVIDGWSTLILRARSSSRRGDRKSVRQPSARRISPARGRARKPVMERPRKNLRKGHGLASAEFRYRPTSGRPAPSARHMPAAGAANRQKPLGPRSTSSRRT